MALEQGYIFNTETARLKMSGQDDILTTLRDYDDGGFYYIVPAEIQGTTQDVLLWFHLDEDEGRIVIQSDSYRYDDIVVFQVTVQNNDTKVVYVASGSNTFFDLNTIYIPVAEAMSNAGSCGHLTLYATLAVKSRHLQRFIDASEKIMQEEPEMCHPILSCIICGPGLASRPNPPPPYPRSWMPLFRNGPFMDDKGTNFDIIVKGTTFYTHKSVLMTESPVFVDMMANHLQEGNRGSVNIVDFEPEEVKMFLTIYYDRATFPDYSGDCGSLISIHRLAHKYEVDDMIQRCVQAFDTVTFDPEQHYATLIFDADLYGVPELMERCAREFDNLPESYLDDFPDFMNANPKAAAAFFKQLAKVRRKEPKS